MSREEKIPMFDLRTGKNVEPGDENFAHNRSDAQERAEMLLSDNEKNPEHTRMTIPERGGMINLEKLEKSEPQPEPRVSQIVPPAEKPPGSMDVGAAG